MRDEILIRVREMEQLDCRRGYRVHNLRLTENYLLARVWMKLTRSKWEQALTDDLTYRTALTNDWDCPEYDVCAEGGKGVKRTYSSYLGILKRTNIVAMFCYFRI